MAEAQEAGRAGMYALWVSIIAGTENRSFLERLAALAVEGLGIDQGLKGITFVFDESAGEYGGESIGEYCAFSLWASKEDTGRRARCRALSEVNPFATKHWENRSRSLCCHQNTAAGRIAQLVYFASDLDILSMREESLWQHRMARKRQQVRWFSKLR